jgi:hypothetical protein
MIEQIAKEKNKSAEWLEAEQEKIRKKYGKKKKAAAIAEGIMGTALAVINALQTKPFLPMGPIMAGIAAAAGSIQIAAIRAAPLAKGGIIPPGYPGDTFPAMLTSGEMVIPSHEADHLYKRGRLDINIGGEIGCRGEDLYWAIEQKNVRS